MAGLIRKQYENRVQELRKRVDAVLGSEDQDFKDLLGKSEKTFEDLREIAEKRMELLEDSEAAKVVLKQLDTFRKEFREKHPEIFPKPKDKPERPELTEEQREALAEHRDSLKEKEAALNELLKKLSEDYAGLLDKEEKTPKEIREMLKLRRELIAESDEAQAVIEAIQEMIADFREENPDLARPKLPQAGKNMAKVKAGLAAIKALTGEINDTLAGLSDEYSALLAKEDKTEEDMLQLRELREELLAENPEAQKLAEAVVLIKNRLHHSRRRQLPKRRPGTLPGAGADDAEKEEEEGE